MTVTSHAAILAAMEEQDRANIRALMIGTPGEPGMNGLAAVLRAVTPAERGQPYDEGAHASLLKLIDYAFGFALGLHSERLPLDIAVDPSRWSLAAGHAAGWSAVPSRVNPAPVERFAR